MENSEQKIKGDRNITSGRDTISNYYNDEEIDFGIIDEIIEYVAEQAEDSQTVKSRSEELLETKKKIKLNFKAQYDENAVQEYFTLAYTKLSYVEKKFASLPTEDQKDVHAFLLNEYNSKKSEGLKNIDILHHLFRFVIPKNKSKNPKYLNSAHAIILLFFDDCTLFEKTEKQKQNVQGNLFSEL